MTTITFEDFDEAPKAVAVSGKHICTIKSVEIGPNLAKRTIAATGSLPPDMEGKIPRDNFIIKVLYEQESPFGEEEPIVFEETIWHGIPHTADKLRYSNANYEKGKQLTYFVLMEKLIELYCAIHDCPPQAEVTFLPGDKFIATFVDGRINNFARYESVTGFSSEPEEMTF